MSRKLSITKVGRGKKPASSSSSKTKKQQQRARPNSKPSLRTPTQPSPTQQQPHGQKLNQKGAAGTVRPGGTNGRRIDSKKKKQLPSRPMVVAFSRRSLVVPFRAEGKLAHLFTSGKPLPRPNEHFPGYVEVPLQSCHSVVCTCIHTYIVVGTACVWVGVCNVQSSSTPSARCALSPSGSLAGRSHV